MLWTTFTFLWYPASALASLPDRAIRFALRRIVALPSLLRAYIRIHQEAVFSPQMRCKSSDVSSLDSFADSPVVSTSISTMRICAASICTRLRATCLLSAEPCLASVRMCMTSLRLAILKSRSVLCSVSSSSSSSCPISISGQPLVPLRLCSRLSSASGHRSDFSSPSITNLSCVRVVSKHPAARKYWW